MRAHSTITTYHFTTLRSATEFKRACEEIDNISKDQLTSNDVKQVSAYHYRVNVQSVLDLSALAVECQQLGTQVDYDPGEDVDYFENL